MNSYERVMNTVMGQPVDYMPASALLSLYGYNYVDGSLEEYYRQSDKFIAGQIEVINRFKPDIIFGPMAAAMEAETFGCNIKFFEDYSPNIRKRVIDKLSETDKIRVPDPTTSPYVKYVCDIIRALKDKVGNEYPVAAIWADPLDLLAIVIGPELLLEMIYFDRTLLDELYSRIEDYSVKVANMFLESGADFIISVNSFLTTRMITRDIAMDIVGPYLTRSFKKINGNIVLHHGGAKIVDYMDIYKDLPNVLGVVIDTRDSIEEAYDKVNKGQLVVGNYPGPRLNKYKTEKIKEQVNAILEKVGERGHFILQTSEADIPLDTSEEQINAYFEAARRVVV